MAEGNKPALEKSLGAATLWGLGVGYVISGEYFGWNLGLPLGGTLGMLIATLVVTAMYVTFTLSYAELACAIPRAGGAFVYATRALGPRAGFLAGWVQIIELVFAPPAIAMAIGAYISQRFPQVDARLWAIGAYLVFTGLNAWGVRQAALFELVVTVLAVGELLLFMGITAPQFDAAAFWTNPLPNGPEGILACLPFAIWFYLAIEGVANAAEEARNPQRDVALAFATAIGTLVLLALGVFFCAVGVAGWSAVVIDPTTGAPSDAPLPLALGHVVPRESALYASLLGVGLLGLIASFHGILLAAGRALMELGRSGLAPGRLGAVHPRTQTPVVALSVSCLVGIVTILSGRTADIITLSCFGAVSLYILSMLSLFRLRRIEPDLPRPFRAVAYPVFPAIALVIALLSLGALAWYNPSIAGVFAGLVALGGLYALLRAPHAQPTPASL